MDSTGKTTLNCPCGATVRGKDEDDVVDRAQQHLRDAHPEREYTRDEILFMAW